MIFMHGGGGGGGGGCCGIRGEATFVVKLLVVVYVARFQDTRRRDDLSDASRSSCGEVSVYLLFRDSEG